MNALLNEYNCLVEQARSLGLLHYRTTQRFRPADSGPERIAQIQNDIRAAQQQRETPAEPTADTPPAEQVVETLPPVEEQVVIGAAVEEETTQSEDEMAKKAKKARAAKAPRAPKAAKTKTKAASANGTAKRGRPPTNGVTIAAKTKEYNDLVPTAKKKGVTWAKVHTSFFGSHTAADAQLKRIQDAIKDA
jgi:hypothetical protein